MANINLDSFQGPVKKKKSPYAEAIQRRIAARKQQQGQAKPDDSGYTSEEPDITKKRKSMGGF